MLVTLGLVTVADDVSVVFVMTAPQLSIQVCMGPILSRPPIHRAVWAGAIEEKVVQLPDRSFLTIWKNGDRRHSKEVSINEEVIGYDVELNHSTDYIYSLGDFPILYNFEAVRKMILPFAIAGVARVISSSEFRPSTCLLYTSDAADE